MSFCPWRTGGSIARAAPAGSIVLVCRLIAHMWVTTAKALPACFSTEMKRDRLRTCPSKLSCSNCSQDSAGCLCWASNPLLCLHHYTLVNTTEDRSMWLFTDTQQLKLFDSAQRSKRSNLSSDHDLLAGLGASTGSFKGAFCGAGT